MGRGEPDARDLTPPLRAAAAGLRRKVKAAIGRAEPPDVYTLHGFALHQLMARGVDIGAGRGHARVADDWEERHVIEEDLKTLLGEGDVRKVRARLRDLAAAWESTPDPGTEDRHGDPELIGATGCLGSRFANCSWLVDRLGEDLVVRSAALRGAEVRFTHKLASRHEFTVERVLLPGRDRLRFAALTRRLRDRRLCSRDAWVDSGDLGGHPKAGHVSRFGPVGDGRIGIAVTIRAWC